jgi:hypothetical protein
MARAARPSLSHFSTRGVAVRLFITCWLVFALHFATNTVREIYPAVSLGDHLSFDVSEYAGLHPDIFEIPDRGAFINNNPGASILGAVPYALLRPVTDRVVEHVRRKRALNPQSAPPEYDSPYPMAREFHRRAYERGLDVKLGLASGVMQVFCMAPLSALSAVVIFYILLGLNASPRAALWLALLYAIATPIFYRTAHLNQNILVSHFALFAFASLWRPWDNPAAFKRPRYFVAGLLCGWAVVLDYSGLVVLLVMSVYGLMRRRSLPASAKSRADIWQFAAGVCLCAAALMAYQWSCFGNPFLPAQSYMPPTPYTAHGYRGMSLPSLDLLWETAFGIRFGLFTSAPLLLLALYIPGWFRRRALALGNRETWCIVGFSLLFLLFCAANQYGWMQFFNGVRYVVPVVPFLFLLVACVLVRIPARLAVLIGVVTAYWSWSLSMYRDVEFGLGVFESPIHITLEGFRLPWLTTIERMGYLPNGTSAIPLLVLCGVFLWVLWRPTFGQLARANELTSEVRALSQAQSRP